MEEERKEEEYIEIDILPECFLCFDNQECNFITLKCCNSKNIHNQCLFNIFINYLKLLQSEIQCPLCRQNLSIKDYFTLDECILYFTQLSEPLKKKYNNKFNAIITFNYLEQTHVTHVTQVDETTSINRDDLDKSLCKKYAFTIVLFIVLVFVVICFKLLV